MRREVILLSGFCYWVMMFSQSAQASEDDPMTRVVNLNQEAINSYLRMDIDGATAILMKAEGICIALAANGPELALTYLNMGVIEAAGRQSYTIAQDFFVRAVCLDPIVMMDPNLATPELEGLFNTARDSVLENPDICATDAAPDDIPPPPPSPPDHHFSLPTAPQEGTPPPQSENVRHAAPLQQTKLTPVPLYIEVKPGLPVGQVILFYRTDGERLYQQKKMRPKGRGYAEIIGCDVIQTFNPTVIEYYIAIMDESGQVTGFAGEAEYPFQVSMVDALVGQAPSLPDSLPPATCTEECPPWNLECNGDCKIVRYTRQCLRSRLWGWSI